MKYQSAAQVVEKIKSGHRVFVHGGAATPQVLLNALAEHAKSLERVELIHLHLEGQLPHLKELKGNVSVANLFVGPQMRPCLDYKRIDYLPCFLSEIPALFRSQRRPLDVALIHVSAPDAHGFCTLGTSVDVARAAVDSAAIVLAQVNKQMPRIHGDGLIHINQFHGYVEVDQPLVTAHTTNPTKEEKKIGELIAGLVEDGATIQVGIGGVPNAVLDALKGHKNLGLHTEMWSSGALELLKSGVINNSQKKVHRGKSVSSFIIGSKEVYDFVNDNPAVIQLESSYVNNPDIIARNPKVVAINSAVEVDLTGQVCADSVGASIISGVGGQMDFIRGASLSEGGKPVIAMTSQTRSGVSRIVPFLKQGAGVVTTRAHVHYIVTEYGIADLYGKTLGERSKALIGIAHPSIRDELENSWTVFCERGSRGDQ